VKVLVRILLIQVIVIKCYELIVASVIQTLLLSKTADLEFTSLYRKKKDITDVLFPLSLALNSQHVTCLIPHLIMASEPKCVYTNAKRNVELCAFQSLERKPCSLLKYNTHYRKCYLSLLKLPGFLLLRPAMRGRPGGLLAGTFGTATCIPPSDSSARVKWLYITFIYIN
jgi:hypothetical protein